MSKCPNCGTTLSCGCQKRTLANGTQGCSKCISPAGKPRTSATNYNNLKDNLDNSAPEINSATLNTK
jgi:hypothetical protein